MSVASTSAVSAAASTATQSTKTTGTTKTLDYDAFLQLFMAELKNQDPTNPPDSSAFVAQLANFSNVEQSVKTNAKLDQLMTLSALSQASSLIGRTVTSADGSTSGVVASLRAATGGAVAVLENGNEIALGEGVTVSNP